MSLKSLSVATGRALFNDVLCCPERFPLSFTLDGVRHTGLGGFPCTSFKRTPTADGDSLDAVFSAAASLTIRVHALYRSAYGQSEYTVWFENNAAEISPVLSDIVALEHTFAGEAPVVRGILGDLQHQYAPYETDLTRQAAYRESTGGRATHVSFPYFNLVHGEGGTLIALGWAGVWNSLFTQTEGGVRTMLRSNPSLNTVLLPGERVRTGLVVLLPYSGRNDDDAMNLWREWFIQCNMPRADASGKALTPFITEHFANDTGLPNSDGSISERYFTWKPSMDKILAENVIPDVRWVDAGWYFDPAGNTVETDWWGTIGSWEMDTVKWPGTTFRDSVDAFHQHGIKTMVWFEPERVTHVNDLVKNYGYKAEWAIDAGGPITNNIGDPDCLKWTADRVISMMEKNGVDIYREDNNANHNQTWALLDREQSAAMGLPRCGIAENKSIAGHYQLWDTILDYCAKAGKCTFVDSCAGGGGRNDIESLRRGVPFMRSDADRTTIGLRLSMSSTFNRWVPFHGSSSKETAEELAPSEGKGADAFVYRASYLPIQNFSEAYIQNPELDYDNLRRLFAEWRSISHLLIRDMYVLTPWHHGSDKYGWTAFAYDAPETDQSLLLAFRQEYCQADTCTVRLPFADADAAYEFENADTGETVRRTGAELLAGLTLKLDTPRSCLMYRIRRV